MLSGGKIFTELEAETVNVTIENVNTMTVNTAIVANQASVQMLTPFPAFGLVTLTVLNIPGYLMLLGIYNSASLVSTNNNLRKYIRRHALLKSNLLDLIGHAEMEKEIQQTVTDIIENQDIPEINKEVELDENELRRYIDIVIREVKKGERTPGY